MNTELMFSSKDQTWSTPEYIFNRLNLEFNFTLDVCAFPETAKCQKYFTPDIDGLKQDWYRDICFCNPPYDDCKSWVKKAYEESVKGAIVVLLLPCRPDNKYWAEYCMKASEIRFVKGRLRFGNSNNSAPFPSCLVIFNYYNWDGFLRVSTYDKGKLTLISLEKPTRNVINFI